MVAVWTTKASSSSLIRRGRPPAHRGSRPGRSRCTSGSGRGRCPRRLAPVSRSTGERLPPAKASSMIVRRNRTELVLLRRTICGCFCPSWWVNLRTRTGSATTLQRSDQRGTFPVKALDALDHAGRALSGGCRDTAGRTGDVRARCPHTRQSRASWTRSRPRPGGGAHRTSPSPRDGMHVGSRCGAGSGGQVVVDIDAVPVRAHSDRLSCRRPRTRR